MEIVINIESPEPLFGQLIEQIRTGVQEGELKPGEPLPSIRQLAGDLGLNSKTVAKAYRLLERDCLIQTRGYRGTFVHPEAPANSSIDLSELAQAECKRAISTMREAGLTDSEIRLAFTATLNNHAD